MLTEEQRKYITEKFTFPDYFGPKKGANCVLAWNSSCKHWVWWPHNGCHGVLSSKYRPGTHTMVFSTLWCRHENLYDAACDYWNYLLDPKESPFRSILKDVERFYDSKGRPIAFGFPDNNVAAQLAVPLMMQCRVPQEHSHKLRSWAWWRKAGFTKAESLWLSEHYRLHLDGSLSSLENEGYRHAFDPALGLSMKALIDGPSDYMKDKLLSTAGSAYSGLLDYGPVNSVWSSSASMYPVLDKLLTGKNVYKGAFPALYAKYNKDMTIKGHGICDKVTAAEILKKNREAWSVVKND